MTECALLLPDERLASADGSLHVARFNWHHHYILLEISCILADCVELLLCVANTKVIHIYVQYVYGMLRYHHYYHRQANKWEYFIVFLLLTTLYFWIQQAQPLMKAVLIMFFGRIMKELLFYTKKYLYFIFYITLLWQRPPCNNECQQLTKHFTQQHYKTR